jgi:thiamine-monophosphate kinase
VIDPDARVGELGERALLRHIRSRIPLGPGVVVGVGDDAAAIETRALTLVTTDSMVEDIHFRRSWTSPFLLGRKALTINLSDIAAMAGVARYATVSLCLPPDLQAGFVDGLYDGLLERAAETGVSIVGGNLSAANAGIVVDITLFGDGDRLLCRGGAQPGDLAVVTGTLGAAAAGLRLLTDGRRLGTDGEVENGEMLVEPTRRFMTHCLRAQLDPAPPLALGRAVAEHELARAGMDVSDGLSGDLLNMCQESGVSAWIDAEGVPVDPAASGLEREGGRDGFSLALHGGEDYQLLLAVPPDRLDALRDMAVVWNIRLSVVGQFTEGAPGVSLKFGDVLRRLRPRSHEHFKEPTRKARADEARDL